MATLVTFHAHPDDEALLTAGVMAKAAAEGHRVVLVVATHGEAGEVDRTFLGDDDLGERRTTETEASASALGVAPGGVPRLPRLRARRRGRRAASVGVAVDEAGQRLAAVLREEHADVLTTYDPNGGYGHPDHVHVHDVGRACRDARGHPDRARGDGQP